MYTMTSRASSISIGDTTIQNGMDTSALSTGGGDPTFGPLQHSRRNVPTDNTVSVAFISEVVDESDCDERLFGKPTTHQLLMPQQPQVQPTVSDTLTSEMTLMSTTDFGTSEMYLANRFNQEFDLLTSERTPLLGPDTLDPVISFDIGCKTSPIGIAPKESSTFVVTEIESSLLYGGNLSDSSQDDGETTPSPVPRKHLYEQSGDCGSSMPVAELLTQSPGTFFGGSSSMERASITYVPLEDRSSMNEVPMTTPGEMPSMELSESQDAVDEINGSQHPQVEDLPSSKTSLSYPPRIIDSNMKVISSVLMRPPELEKTQRESLNSSGRSNRCQRMLLKSAEEQASIQDQKLNRNAKSKEEIIRAPHRQTQQNMRLVQEAPSRLNRHGSSKFILENFDGLITDDELTTENYDRMAAYSDLVDLPEQNRPDYQLAVEVVSQSGSYQDCKKNLAGVKEAARLKGNDESMECTFRSNLTSTEPASKSSHVARALYVHGQILLTMDCEDLVDEYNCQCFKITSMEPTSRRGSIDGKPWALGVGPAPSFYGRNRRGSITGLRLALDREHERKSARGVPMPARFRPITQGKDCRGCRRWRVEVRKSFELAYQLRRHTGAATHMMLDLIHEFRCALQALGLSFDASTGQIIEDSTAKIDMEAVIKFLARSYHLNRMKFLRDRLLFRLTVDDTDSKYEGGKSDDSNLKTNEKLKIFGLKGHHKYYSAFLRTREIDDHGELFDVQPCNCLYISSDVRNLLVELRVFLKQLNVLCSTVCHPKPNYITQFLVDMTGGRPKLCKEHARHINALEELLEVLNDIELDNSPRRPSPSQHSSPRLPESSNGDDVTTHSSPLMGKSGTGLFQISRIMNDIKSPNQPRALPLSTFEDDEAHAFLPTFIVDSGVSSEYSDCDGRPL